MDIFSQPHYYDEIHDDILLAYRSGTHYHNIFHKHNGYEIYIFLCGNTNLLIEHSCVHLERGNIAIINPTEYHLAVSLDDSLYERITLNISPAIMRSLSTHATNFNSFFDSRKCGVNNVILLPEDTLKELITLINKLNDTLHSDQFGSDVLQRAYLAQILCTICNNYIVYKGMAVNIMPELVSKTIQYVEEHISENFSLADIETSLNFNNRYISRMFKQNTGISLKQYILEKKVVLAQSLLSEGYSVMDACDKCGFRDYSNFIRTFKLYTGKTPGSFKKHK
ncbi:MAG: AraC family transcriptional regulator [Lachnospiraceae bacterium]|nr:AraC family transcriptional regulator [Lachnospiraceae bacterium]